MNNQSLLDEREVLHGLNRFARILDKRQWDCVGEVFADDVTFNYGDGREQAGILALRQQFRQFLDVCGPSQHLLGSIDITVHGDTATTCAYVQARHQGAGAKSHLFFDSNGEYIDHWQRRSEGWRVVRRDVHWLMHMGDLSVLHAS